MSTDLIRTASIEERCLARDAALDAFDQMQALAERANAHWQKACGDDGKDALSRKCHPSIWASPCRHGSSYRSHDDREDLRSKLDADAWRAVFNFSGMERLMSAKQVKEFRNQLSEKPPNFTVDTVRATFSVYMENPETVFRQSVRDAFDALPGRFKSNDRFKIGSKLVMEYALSWTGRYPTWHHGWSHRHTTRRAELADLHRMLRMIDGNADKPCITDTAGAAMRDDTSAGRFADDYMEVKWFKNGNIHVWMLRPNLVRVLNKVLADEAGDVLPQAA